MDKAAFLKEYHIAEEDLLAAKVTPDEYKNLRVRVSGFSDYFVKLNEELQDDVINRLRHKC
jgi:formate C-acetyltransferase